MGGRIADYWYMGQSSYIWRPVQSRNLERSKPATSGAILKYLSSGAIKGVGAATAAKIVEMFGEQTLDIIEQEPERLCAIKRNYGV